MKKIELPTNYSFSTEEDNKIISDINSNFKELEDALSNSGKLDYDKYIPDFESFEIDIYFSNNSKKATISVFNDTIQVKFNNNIVRIDEDGAVT